MSTPDADGLFELDHRWKTREYLAQLWGRRDYLLTVPRRDVQAQNSDLRLGQFWLIMNPAMMIAVYFVVFGVVLDSNRGSADFLTRLVVGVLIFRLSQRMITSSINVISSNRAFIRTIQFPRALLPLSTVLGQTWSFLPSLVVMFGVVVVAGFPVRWQWIVLIVPLASQLLLNTGFSLIAARAGFVIKDLGQLLTHVFRVLMYSSGVIFPIEDYITSQTALDLLAINPFFDLLALARWSVLGTSVTSLQLWILLAWTLALPPLAFRFFLAGEGTYGE